MVCTQNRSGWTRTRRGGFGSVGYLWVKVLVEMELFLRGFWSKFGSPELKLQRVRSRPQNPCSFMCVQSGPNNNNNNHHHRTPMVQVLQRAAADPEPRVQGPEPRVQTAAAFIVQLCVSLSHTHLCFCIKLRTLF